MTGTRTTNFLLSFYYYSFPRKRLSYRIYTMNHSRDAINTNSHSLSSIRNDQSRGAGNRHNRADRSQSCLNTSVNSYLYFIRNYRNTASFFILLTNVICTNLLIGITSSRCRSITFHTDDLNFINKIN